MSAGALARPGPITLACIGAGYQAWTQVEAVSRVRPIGRLLVWSRTRERAEGFAARVRDGLGLPATPVAAVADAVAGADVVTAATKARDPVYRGAGIRPGTHVVLAGSSHADRREADTDVFARAAAVFTDDLDLARAHSGDLRAAVADGARPGTMSGDLGAALDGPARCGRTRGRLPCSARTASAAGTWNWPGPPWSGRKRPARGTVWTWPWANGADGM